LGAFFIHSLNVLKNFNSQRLLKKACILIQNSSPYSQGKKAQALKYQGSKSTKCPKSEKNVLFIEAKN